jgi:hypothetical protein
MELAIALLMSEKLISVAFLWVLLYCFCTLLKKRLMETSCLHVSGYTVLITVSIFSEVTKEAVSDSHGRGKNAGLGTQ